MECVSPPAFLWNDTERLPSKRIISLRVKVVTVANTPFGFMLTRIWRSANVRFVLGFQMAATAHLGWLGLRGWGESLASTHLRWVIVTNHVKASVAVSDLLPYMRFLTVSAVSAPVVVACVGVQSGILV